MTEFREFGVEAYPVPVLERLMTLDFPADQRVAWACRHLFDPDPPVVLICLEHPKVGFLCPVCVDEHQLRHGPVSCGACGTTEGLTTFVPRFDVLAPVELRTPRGGRASLTGTVHVSGLVLCWPCLGEPEP